LPLIEALGKVAEIAERKGPIANSIETALAGNEAYGPICPLSVLSPNICKASTTFRVLRSNVASKRTILKHSPHSMTFKVQINNWHAVANWTWNAGATQLQTPENKTSHF